jgi:formylmethanofuran dehydrogenase subunit E
VATICGLSIREYCEKAEQFHGGHLAPGMVIAGFMVELARRNIPEGTLFEVICETASCIPDAVQILTPCTIGNQWMKIIDVGRYAMTFYDKYTGEGVRVNLDAEKMKDYPAIAEWHLKLKPKREQDTEALISAILEAGEDILAACRIQVTPEFLGKRQKTVGICPVCKESFRSSEGTICPACKNSVLPYVSAPAKAESGR